MRTFTLILSLVALFASSAQACDIFASCVGVQSQAFHAQAFQSQAFPVQSVAVNANYASPTTFQNYAQPAYPNGVAVANVNPGYSRAFNVVSAQPIIRYNQFVPTGVSVRNIGGYSHGSNVVVLNNNQHRGHQGNNIFAINSQHHNNGVRFNNNRNHNNRGNVVFLNNNNHHNRNNGFFNNNRNNGFFNNNRNNNRGVLGNLLANVLGGRNNNHHNNNNRGLFAVRVR